MNGTDRAFIKAYAWDRTEPSPPAPHLTFVPVVGGGSRTLGEAATNSTGAANPRQAASSVAQAPTPQRPPEQNAPARLVVDAAGQPAAVTHFVPAPHLPLAGAYTARKSERQAIHFTSPAAPAHAEVAPVSVSASNSQPLSNFTKQEPLIETFEPALGVPAFQWSETCERLEQDFPPDYTALHALIESRRGEFAPVIAVTGAHRGEGRSTTLLCLGRELARRGLRTIMVDGDFARPMLAEHLGLETSTGWEDVLTGQILLTEAIIYAEQEGLSLLPLGETVRDRHAMASALHVTITLSVLSQHYDVVLVDTGPLCDEPSSAATMLRRAKFSGALLVHDTRSTDDTTLHAAIARLAELHVSVLGVIENFGSELAQTPSHDQRQFAA